MVEPSPVVPADHVLQALANEARDIADTPVALLSLLQEYTQGLEARVGLPAAVEGEPSASRWASFCQCVVRSRRSWYVEDAATVFDLPQGLVEQLGVRAYLGLPVYVAKVVRGALCVLDVRPRRWGQDVWERLTELADQASQRLDVLAGVSPLPANRVDRVAHELDALVRLMAAVSQGPLTVEDARVALAVMGQPLQLLQRLHHDASLREDLQDTHQIDLSELARALSSELGWRPDAG